jgi:hypothetical protein
VSYEKPEPYIVTFVPPLTKPLVGVIEDTCNGGRYINVIASDIATTPSKASTKDTGPVDDAGGETH